VALLTPPYALGAAGQVLSARLLRLSLGAAFRPAAGVQVTSGVLAGPSNTMGELSLASGVLTVQPFRAVLEVLDGPLAASQAATTLPTPAGSWLALGEILIPPVGQTVTLTPYNPRIGMRHGIQSGIIADGSTIAGHDGQVGAHVDQFRAHPTRGIERWNGTAWVADGMSKRKIGRVVYLNLHNVYTGAYNRDFLLFTLPAGYTPAGNSWLTGYYFNGAAIGLKIAPNGNVTVDIAGAAGATGGGFVLTGSFPAA
jgi:hypothetical protein